MYYVKKNQKNAYKKKDSVYDEVETYYSENIIHFSKLQNILQLDFGIPKKIAADSIKNYLVGTVNEGANTYLLRPKKFQSSILFILAGGYFLIMSIFGKSNKKKVSSDIVFENCYSFTFDVNYHGIYQRLNKYSKKVLQTFRSGKDTYIDSQQKSYEEEIFTKGNLIYAYSKYSNYYSSRISRKIFSSCIKRYISYLNLTTILDIDVLQLAIRIYRSIAIHETDVANINAKVLITLDDNGYGALRYHIYKKNIGTIVAIQNGVRFGHQSNRMGDQYLYSDHYFGFGLKNIILQKGMESMNKVAVGSLRLYNSLSQMKITQNLEIEYDVLFLEQLSEVDLPAYKIETYMKCIDMLCKFATENTEYRIAYRARLDRKDMKYFNATLNHNAIKIESKLISAGVYLSLDMNKNSYMEVMKSHVVIFYTTTLGFEAIGMNRRVLNMNLDKLSFCFSTNNDLSTLVDDNYELFKSKLLLLLNSRSNELEEHYKKRKIDYMNTNENIEEVIFHTVQNEIIKGGKYSLLANIHN
jgi:hypothetical protein